MKEIEIKFQLNKTDEEKFLSWLAEKAKFEKTESHLEFYVENPSEPFTFKDENGIRDSLSFFRIRQTAKGSSMCLKKFYRDENRPGFTTHCDEYEFNISDFDAAKNMLNVLGYTDSTEVNKNRKVYVFENIEICVDEVKNLGIFFEIELKEQIEDAKIGKEKLLEFLRELGIKEINEMRRGYVSMLWNPETDFGSKTQI